MLFIRRQKSLLLQRRSLFFLVAIAIAWICGVFDHLFEESFDEFRWPPYGVDVELEVLYRRFSFFFLGFSSNVHFVQTRRAIAGGSLKVPHENDLRLFHRMVEPECERRKTPRLLIIVKSSIHNELVSSISKPYQQLYELLLFDCILMF